MKKTIITLIFSVIFSLSTNAASNKSAQLIFVEEYTKDAIAQVLPMWLVERGVITEKNIVESVYAQILSLDIEFINTNIPRHHRVQYEQGKVSIITNINHAPSYINEYFILRLLDTVSVDISLEGTY